MTQPLPIVWVLKSFRAGDNAQALELARRVGGTVVEKQLAFNRLASLPNVVSGISIRMLTNEARSLLVPPWPDLVIATGRRTAVVSCWIKKQSGGKTKTVQLGRPRLPLNLFDLVIATPQYGLPQAPNVIHLPLPFVSQRKPPVLSDQDVWMHLPSPRIAAVIGGQKFPLRLGQAELRGFGSAVERLAHSCKASVILLDSPRSPSGGLGLVASQIQQPKWQPGPSSKNAYNAALASADMFCVTSDSVSMVAEMLATGRPVYVYQLPQSPLMPHWQADKGLMSFFAKRGLLSPPRDTAGLMRSLVSQGAVGDLASMRAPVAEARLNARHEDAIRRVRSLVGL